MHAEGPTFKLFNVLKSPVQVYAEVGEHILHLNALIGRSISLEYKGQAICKSCKRDFESLFRMGCCKKCFFESPLAGASIFRPELSRAHLNIEDRDLDHEKSFQLQPHVVYLADAGQIKVGVTRLDQVHNRWMDQGAGRARIIAKTNNRHEAGLIEVELKSLYSDKTNWKQMLNNKSDGRELKEEAIHAKESVSNNLKRFFDLDGEQQEIHYDYNIAPANINSFSLKDSLKFKDDLFGLRGQYLIFSSGNAINLRSHEGLVLSWSY